MDHISLGEPRVKFGSQCDVQHRRNRHHPKGKKNLFHRIAFFTGAGKNTLILLYHINIFM